MYGTFSRRAAGVGVPYRWAGPELVSLPCTRTDNPAHRIGIAMLSLSATAPHAGVVRTCQNHCQARWKGWLRVWDVLVPCGRCRGRGRNPGGPGPSRNRPLAHRPTPSTGSTLPCTRSPPPRCRVLMPWVCARTTVRHSGGGCFVCGTFSRRAAGVGDSPGSQARALVAISRLPPCTPPVNPAHRIYLAAPRHRAVAC